MSCCQGNCGCGSNCQCGNGCGGCKMYGDLNEFSGASSTTVIFGAAPKMTYADESAVSSGENGCKCGDNCTCNPCSCK